MTETTAETETSPFRDGLPIAIIVNPVAGSGLGDRLAVGLRSALGGQSCGIREFRTRGAGEAGALAAVCRADDYRALVIVGGDGTIHEAISGLPPDGPPILIAPCGTENLMGRYLRLKPRADLLVDVLRTGKTVTFDLGAMSERKFLAIAGIGFDAEVVRRLVARRTGAISYASYVRPLLTALRDFHQPPVRVADDSGIVFEGAGLVFVGVISRYAAGFSILRRALPDDGLIDLCILPCERRRTLVAHAIRVWTGRHLETPGVIYRQVRTVRVSSEAPVGVELDGEWAGHLPVEIRVLPGAVRFLVPVTWGPSLR